MANYYRKNKKAFCDRNSWRKNDVKKTDVKIDSRQGKTAIFRGISCGTSRHLRYILFRIWSQKHFVCFHFIFVKKGENDLRPLTFDLRPFSVFQPKLKFVSTVFLSPWFVFGVVDFFFLNGPVGPFVWSLVFFRIVELRASRRIRDYFRPQNRRGGV